ncbi:MotE family protein [Paenibacillus sp. TH7-28]
MAKTELKLEEELEESGGGFSRFLFFMTPILFTVVLFAVLLYLFNTNFRNTLLDIGNKVPFISNFVPDPELTDGEKATAATDVKKQQESTDATVKELKEQVARQQTELQAANQQAAEQQDKAKQLEQELAAAKQQSAEEQQAAEAEAYQKEVKKLAQLYAEMSPSKAAAIFGNLTTDEMLQMLNAMSNESKVAILEKMDPQKAADISIKLKDVKSSDDLAIAALQSRLKKDAASEAAAAGSAKGLDDAQLSQTFASMSADAASQLILQTYKVSPDKGLKILKAIDDNTRSKILENMTKTDEKTSVKILNQLLAK